MKVTLKNNTYNISSSCSVPIQDNGDYKCHKYYEIKLQSKYNLFKYNKDLIAINYAVCKTTGFCDVYSRSNDFEIITDLYYINDVQVYNPNKSDLYLRITEEGLNKILKSHSLKIILPLRLFSKDTLIKEYYRIFGNNGYYDLEKLKPTIILDTSNISIYSLKNQCKQELNECKIKADKLNSPLNRVKRFFNFGSF